MHIDIADQRSSDDPVQFATPYEKLAPIYDHVMSHVDYVVWADFALTVMSDHGLVEPRSVDAVKPSRRSFSHSPIPICHSRESGNPVPPDHSESPRLLECACGTGTIAVILALNGYRIDAFDRSPEMIKVARSKASHMNSSPNFTVADFQTFDHRRITKIRRNPPDKYDAVLCLYDSVNYLMEAEHIRSFLIRVFQSLKKNGLFLFDVCTVFNSQRFFSDQIENIRGTGYNCIRKMNFDSRRMIQENVFVIRQGSQPDDPEQSDVYIEKHYQRIYPLPVIRRLIAESGFHILEEMDEKSRRPPHNRSLRVHFLCRKGLNNSTVG